MSPEHRRTPVPPNEDAFLPVRERSEYYEAARVRLVVIGEDVDPGSVTDWLGCSPDHGHRRGARAPSMDSSIVPKAGLWVKGVHGGRDESVSDCILRLLGEMTEDLSRWEELCSRYDPFLTVFIDPEGGTGSFALSDEVVAELGRRRLRVHLGVSCRSGGVAEGIPLVSPRWRELQTAFGPATRVQGNLGRVLGGVPSKELEEALWSDLVHQGTVYTGSLAAVPHLVKAASCMSPRARVGWLLLVAAIEEGRRNAGDQAFPEDLVAGLDAALQSARALLAESLFDGEWDGEMATLLLGAAALLMGQPDLGEALQLAEDWVECPSCGEQFNPVRKTLGRGHEAGER